MAGPVSPTEREISGAHRVSLGAGLGVAAALISVVLPIAFLLLASYAPGGFFQYGQMFFQALSVLLLAGAILFVLSLVIYRLGFGALRATDKRFVPVSILCLVGSVGFLLLLVTAAILIGGSNGLVLCIQGRPTHTLSCLEATQPLGAYTGLVGFWLVWLGGWGLVAGLVLFGTRYHQGTVSVGSGLYAILLLVLVGPFVALLFPFAGAQYLLLSAPILALLAPAFVFAGSRVSFPVLAREPSSR